MRRGATSKAFTTFEHRGIDHPGIPAPSHLLFQVCVPATLGTGD